MRPSRQVLRRGPHRTIGIAGRVIGTDGDQTTTSRHHPRHPLVAGPAEDQVAEVKRLLTLGATEVHWDRKPADADYVIMADPEGNRFCVIDAG